MLPSLHSSASPLDLHVLGTPPAFVLSQDQTLVLNPSELTLGIPSLRWLSLIPELTVFSQTGLRVLSLPSPGPRLFLFLYRFQGSSAPLRTPVRRADSLIIISLLPSPVNPFFDIFYFNVKNSGLSMSNSLLRLFPAY